MLINLKIYKGGFKMKTKKSISNFNNIKKIYEISKSNNDTNIEILVKSYKVYPIRFNALKRLYNNYEIDIDFYNWIIKNRLTVHTNGSFVSENYIKKEKQLMEKYFIDKINNFVERLNLPNGYKFYYKIIKE